MRLIGDFMVYKINGIDLQGNEDSIIIEADTIEELQEIAKAETQKRKWNDCWSEKVS